MTGCPVAGRRALLLSGLAGVVGGAAACTSAAVGGATAPPSPSTAPSAGAGAVRPFRGPRQSGIADPPQTYAAFVALDLAKDLDAAAVRRLFTVWTDDIERLMAGRGPLTDLEPELAAVPAGLTVTLAVGPRVVALTGREAPPWLKPLPRYPAIDRLEPRWTGGDLLLQVCADSPNTVAHAQRRLITAAGPMVSVRWVQRGFREPFEGPGLPMRNLFGQVDGTVQPRVDGPDDPLLFVTADSGPSWLVGGSGVVVRRIAMNLDTWDRVDRDARENSIGRRLTDGAPLVAAPGGPTGPTASPDLSATDDLGFHRIDDFSHVRRAAPARPEERFLRRPYSYDDPQEGAAGTQTGLVFVAYAADVGRQFAPVQARLAEADLLNIWTTPIGSAVFAVLPGARHGEILGQALLA